MVPVPSRQLLTVLERVGNGWSAIGTTALGSPNWASTGDVTGDGRADLVWFESWKGHKRKLGFMPSFL